MNTGNHRRWGDAGLRRKLTVGAAVLTSCLVLAACGSSAVPPPTTSSSVTTSTSSASASSSSLSAIVSAAEKVPQYSAPGPAVSASAMKGKSVLVFPINNEIDACNAQAADFAALAKELGMNVTNFHDSGVPTEWVSAIQDATSAHDAAVVMLCGVIPGAVGPQLTAAHKAGLKVVDGNYNETTNYSGLDGETAVDVAGGMRDDVADALLQLHGKALHALMVTSSSVIQGPAAEAAVKSAVSSLCTSGCSVDATVNVPVQNWATSTQGDVSSALLAHPDINAVFVAFDGMAAFAQAAIEQAHRPGLKLYSWGGGRSVEKLMEVKNPIIAADPGPDEMWDAYEAMDQVIRLVTGHASASVAKELDPNRFWVPSNVSQFFGPGGTYGNEGYGKFVAGFDHLWGVKG